MSAFIRKTKNPIPGYDDWDLWLRCDSCGREVLVYEHQADRLLIHGYIHSNGWRTRKTGDKWENLCPDCKDGKKQRETDCMNSIENRFAAALCAECNVFSFEDMPNEEEHCLSLCEPQKPMGIYIVDFYMEDASNNKFVVEIDGHESHKTKQQRYEDYVRERWLQKQMITVIRFTGSEIFVDAKKCAKECLEIIDAYAEQTSGIEIHAFEIGQRCANKSA